MSTTLCSHYSVLLNARGRLKVKTMGVGAELCCASNAPLLVFPLPVNSPQSILSPVDSLPSRFSPQSILSPVDSLPSRFSPQSILSPVDSLPVAHSHKRLMVVVAIS